MSLKLDPKAATGVPLLSEVVRYYLDNYDKRKPMYRKHAAALPMFLECLRDRPVDQLKQMDIEDFCKMLCRLPPRWPDEVKRRRTTVKAQAELEHPKTISPKTFECSYMASVSPFLSLAKRIYGDVGFPAHLTVKGIEYRGVRRSGDATGNASG